MRPSSAPIVRATRELAAAPQEPAARSPHRRHSGRAVITAHLHTNGPLPEARIFDWFGNGLGAKKRDVRRWLAQLADRLTTVTIEGDEVMLLHDDLEGLANTSASEVVRMLPGRDTWVIQGDRLRVTWVVLSFSRAELTSP